MNTLGQARLFSTQEHSPVAYTVTGEVFPAEFRRRVDGITRHLLQHPEQRWALVCDDTLWFAAGFLALTNARKTVILPQASGPSNVAEAQAAAVLTDQPARFASFIRLDVAAASGSDTYTEAGLDDSLSVELYTSGSTGRPKRVDKQLRQLRAEVMALEAQWGQQLGDAVVLASVPHHHLYGLLFRVLWPLWTGRPFYAASCMQMSEFNAAARRFERCFIVSSPAFLTRVTDFGLLQPKNAFVALFSSGAPLPETTAAKIATELGHATIEVYGSTETGGIAWRSWEPASGQTPWQAFTDVETTAPEIIPGLLRVRSPWTWRAAWVDSGDLAQALPQNRFRLCGRADSVLKVEDKRISLAEMEQRLAAHELVSAARLLLLEGNRTSVGAVVVLNNAGRRQVERTGTPDVRKALMEMLRDWYDPVLVPRKWRFVEALPGNDMGKIEHEKLQALFMERP
ncbi:MAG: AMP-binding protein [Gammaproteobacteria bacterium]